MSEAAFIAFGGLLLSALAGMAALIWRAGVEFGRINSRLEKAEDEAKRLHSYHKELKGQLEKVGETATRAEMKSGLDWKDE